MYCVKNVQMWSFFWSVFFLVCISKNSVFRHFSRSDESVIYDPSFWLSLFIFFWKSVKSDRSEWSVILSLIWSTWDVFLQWHNVNAFVLSACRLCLSSGVLLTFVVPSFRFLPNFVFEQYNYHLIKIWWIWWISMRNIVLTWAVVRRCPGKMVFLKMRSLQLY